MTPDDVRLTAQLVVDKRVHCCSDDAVMALARRVLELEVALDAVRAVGVSVERREDGTGLAVTNTRAVDEVAAEREACAKLCERLSDESNQPSFPFDHCAAAIRARGAK